MKMYEPKLKPIFEKLELTQTVAGRPILEMVHELFHASEALERCDSVAIVKGKGYFQIETNDAQIGEHIIEASCAGRLGEMLVQQGSVKAVMDVLETKGLPEFFESEIAADDFSFLLMGLSHEYLMKIAPGILKRGVDFIGKMKPELLQSLCIYMQGMKVGERITFKSYKTIH